MPTTGPSFLQDLHNHFHHAYITYALGVAQIWPTQVTTFSEPRVPCRICPACNHLVHGMIHPSSPWPSSSLSIIIIITDGFMSDVDAASSNIGTSTHRIGDVSVRDDGAPLHPAACPLEPLRGHWAGTSSSQGLRTMRLMVFCDRLKGGMMNNDLHFGSLCPSRRLPSGAQRLST